MTIAKLPDGRIVLTLTLEELAAMRQCLNEVCHGYEVPDFEKRIGAREDRVALLLKQTSRHNPAKVETLVDGKYRVTFSADEARVIANAMTETLSGDGIGRDEYFARIGAYTHEIEAVRSAILSALSS